MRLFIRTALIVALTGGAALAGPADDKAAPNPRWGSVTRQLMLKYRLQKIVSGTLVASLDHNRRRWEGLSPDQRNQFRQDAYAFEKKSLARKQELLKHYDKLLKLPPDKREAYRRAAKWINVVAASFTAEERRQLKALSLDQRAQRLLERKAQLIREGKLPDDGATTTPATKPAAPTTQPSK